MLNPEDMNIIAGVARSHDVAIHVDGARIFNAAVYLGISPAELARSADTVSFCLSKGLSCPVGSLVCGSTEVISRVRKGRKVLGGGMRQAGVIAAAGLVALDTMVDRLSQDHGNARVLARGLASVPGVSLDAESVQTNIVMVDVIDRPAHEFIAALKSKGVLVTYPGGKRIRMVTHYGIEEGDIAEALNVIENVARNGRGVLNR